MEWTELTPEQAAQQKYYGLGGWLLALYALAVLAFVGSFLGLAGVPALKEAFGDAYVIIVVLSLVQAILHLPFIILAPKKHPLMPKAAVSAYWLSVSLTAIAALLTDPSHMLGQLVVGVIYVSLFQWYMNKSKRVNVTYRHRIPADTSPESKTGSETDTV